jgi:hypothetical protein
MVDNTDYPTKGGHMTSQDTQTNWNGITGEISVRIYEDVYIDNIRTFPDIHNKSVKVKLRINGADGINIAVFAFMEDESTKSGISSFAPTNMDIQNLFTKWTEIQSCGANILRIFIPWL